MKNNLLRKALVYLLAAVLLVSISVGATIAYFTDSEGVTNTFTVGKVAISMDEAAVNPDGTPIENAARVTSNEYHLIPGKTYTKDPIVYVSADSEDCYVFVKVVNDLSPIEIVTEGATKKISTQMMNFDWLPVDGVDNVYVYAKVVAKNDTDKDLEVFQNFTIDGSVTNEMIAEYATDTNQTCINVTAYAIQAAGFDTAEKAWEALSSQVTIQ